MNAVIPVLVFAVVWLVVTAFLGWGIEGVLHRWVERRFGVKARYTYSRGMAWRITGARTKRHLWMIQTIHVFGIMAAMVGGGFIAMYVMLWVALMVR
jgi:hypothetical protein